MIDNPTSYDKIMYSTLVCFHSMRKQSLTKKPWWWNYHHRHLGSEMFHVVGKTIWLIWRFCSSGKMHSWPQRSAFSFTLICFICWEPKMIVELNYCSLVANSRIAIDSLKMQWWFYKVINVRLMPKTLFWKSWKNH
jgi:hypothetical protein